jgi:hypothetical protein
MVRAHWTQLGSWLALGVLLGWSAGVIVVAVAQSPACEQVVGDQYQSLQRDQILPSALAASTWSEQVTALGQELRVTKTQLEIKSGQAQLAERNVATVLERLRLAQQDSEQLKKELELLRSSGGGSAQR